MSFHRNLNGDDLHAPTNIKVLNDTGLVIPALRVVKTDGATGTVMHVTPITTLSDKPLGLTKNDIEDGEQSTIVGIGLMTEVDTSPYAAGNLLFAQADGTLTLADTGVFVGTVLFSDPSFGLIFVNFNIQGDVGPPGGAGIYGVVRITPGGAFQEASITTAMAAAVSGDVVALGPGFYPEDFTIPAGVTLFCPYGPGTAVVTGFSPLGDKVTITDGTRINGLTVLVPFDAAGGIVVNGASRSVIFNTVTVGIGGSGIGIIKNNTDNLTINTFTHQGNCDAVVEQNAGDTLFTTCLIDSGTINDIVRINSGIFRSGNSSFDEAVNATNAFNINGDDVQLELIVIDVRGALNALYINGMNFNLSTRNTLLEGTIYDILVDPSVPSSNIRLVSSELAASRINATTSWWQNSQVGYSFFDADPGNVTNDTTLRVANELTVGSPFIPSKINAGEGDAYVDTMVALRNTNGTIGTWSDITTELLSISGSTAAIFASLAADSSFYIGSSFRFTGFKNVPTVPINLGAGSIIWEYWNGAAWTPTRIMASQIIPPLTQYANTLFQRVQAEHTHIPNLSTAWQTTVLNGFDRYWLRARIVSPITTSPVLEEMKLLPNRMKIGLSGEISFFGLSRPQKFLNWDLGSLFAIVASAPADEALDVSPNIKISLLGNEFRNNSIDAKGGIITIPEGLDTSVDLQLILEWFPLVASGGNVEVEVDYAMVPAVLNGTATEFRISQITASPLVVGTLVTNTFSIPVSSLLPGQQIAIRFFRDATGANADDTLGGSIAFSSTRLVGTFWKP